MSDRTIVALHGDKFGKPCLVCAERVVALPFWSGGKRLGWSAAVAVGNGLEVGKAKPLLQRGRFVERSVWK